MYSYYVIYLSNVRSHGLVVKADGSQSRGCGFEPGVGKLDGCYVDCFT